MANEKLEKLLERIAGKGEMCAYDELLKGLRRELLRDYNLDAR